MKIAILTDQYQPESVGGAETVAANLAKAYQAKNNEVIIITTTRNNSELIHQKIDDIEVYRIPSIFHPRWRHWLGMFNPPVISQLNKLLKDLKPDVVHAHNLHQYLSLYSLAVAKKYASKVILTLHDAMLIHYGKITEINIINPQQTSLKINVLKQIKIAKLTYNPFRNYFYKKMLRKCDYVFAVSKALKKVYELNGIKVDKVIYNGININPSNLTNKTSLKINRMLSKTKNIVFAGRVSENKGAIAAIDMLDKLVQQRQDVRLIILGEKTSSLNNVINYAKKKALEKYVYISGWISASDMPAYYKLADVVVVPSIYWDPCPIIVMEAMLYKKPVVGSFYGGMSEIIVHNKTGFIINPLDSQAFAQAVIMAISNDKLGIEGYKRVNKYFSSYRQAEEYLNYFKV